MWVLRGYVLLDRSLRTKTPGCRFNCRPQWREHDRPMLDGDGQLVAAFDSQLLAEPLGQRQLPCRGDRCDGIIHRCVQDWSRSSIRVTRCSSAL